MPAKGSKSGPRPQEVRDKISASMREALRDQPRWTTIFGPIRRAADAGNRREAIRLLDEYIKNRKREAA